MRESEVRSHDRNVAVVEALEHRLVLGPVRALAREVEVLEMLDPEAAKCRQVIAELQLRRRRERSAAVAYIQLRDACVDGRGCRNAPRQGASRCPAGGTD